MTTGEGGMLVTDDKDVADFAASLRNQGRSGGSAWLDHHVVGYNYRLDEMSCALGLGQLARIDEILAKRSAVADLYAGLLKDVLPVPSARPEVKKSWFVYVLCLPEEYGAGQRDRLLAGLREERIGCNNYFPPIHLQPFYRKAFGYKEGDFPMTEAVSRRTVALPFYNNLREEDVSRVVDTLLGLLARLGAAKADPLVRSA
jgi:perosamine synthetase